MRNGREILTEDSQTIILVLDVVAEPNVITDLEMTGGILMTKDNSRPNIMLFAVASSSTPCLAVRVSYSHAPVSSSFSLSLSMVAFAIGIRFASLYVSECAPLQSTLNSLHMLRRHSSCSDEVEVYDNDDTAHRSEENSDRLHCTPFDYR